mmetsp:Transcript_72800/g.161791  ORF Transcript_72800/g.161791 Transcript_72800/m.161791 type:complete len:224 (-) Transcript_72800:185-856(-)
MSSCRKLPHLCSELQRPGRCGTNPSGLPSVVGFTPEVFLAVLAVPLAVVAVLLAVLSSRRCLHHRAERGVVGSGVLARGVMIGLCPFPRPRDPLADGLSPLADGLSPLADGRDGRVGKTNDFPTGRFAPGPPGRSALRRRLGGRSRVLFSLCISAASSIRELLRRPVLDCSSHFSGAPGLGRRFALGRVEASRTTSFTRSSSGCSRGSSRGCDRREKERAVAM